MKYIKAAEGGKTRREIQEIVGSARPSVVTTLNRMRRDGLIERKPITPPPRNPAKPQYIYEPTGKLP